MFSAFFTFAVLALHFLSSVSSQGILKLDEGDECTINGMTGKCTLPNNCKHINFKKTRPPICSFSDFTPVICCSPKPLQNSQNTLRPSEKMCKSLASFCQPRPVYEKINLFPRVRRQDIPNLEDILTEPSVNNTDFHTTVVGGKDAQARKYKGMAILGFGKTKRLVRWSCGGTLITNRHVLSAAHCAHSTLGKPKWVRVGELDYSTDTDDARPQDRNVEAWISHPNYKNPIAYHDIAIAVMDTAVVFNDWVAPVCLHTKENIPAEKATVVGFGRLGFADQLSTVLQEVDLSLIDGANCRKLFGSEGKITPNGIDARMQLCAGEIAGGKDACLGDSGGPFLISLPGQCQQTLIGVVSIGKQCALPNTPGIYTRVSYYLDWIEKTVWPNGA
ncbi:venom protease-like [Cimex lectularius]|uniref:Peptidase S1 domain-containing protein n=1 Tax=Cimex lectularius TaxID=79782 RepID=A0A8I6SEW1_CIMLE|nr:venom protease-like [Cimex lectularius]